MSEATHIAIERIAGSLGAEISGVDLSQQLADEEFRAVHRALQDHGVVFLRDQKLTREAQLDFAARFGKPEVHPIADGMKDHPEMIRVSKPAGEEAFFGTSWHTDNSFFERPSAITMLYGEEVPPYGGDTVFASMECAYERLSQDLKTMLQDKRAVHSATRAYDPRTTGDAKYRGETAITYTYSDSIHDEVEHPVIRTHAETGRKSIYVNPMFTQRIIGLNPDESDAILEMLYAHSTRPDFTCRFRWRDGSVAIWDNRCVQHYAIDDYRDFDRLMFRVTLEGERPV
jgi:taurine dioxygenase